MGRTDNWGEKPLKRAKHLIKFLLSYDNSERDKLYVKNWRKKNSSRPERDIRTSLLNLAWLLNKDSIKSKYDSQLDKEKKELQSTIDRLKDLDIVQENSTNSEKSKGIRSFTFILWHSSKVQENLKQLELTWQNRPKLKSKIKKNLLENDIQTSDASKKELDPKLKIIIKTYLSKSFSADTFAELDQAGEPETASERRTKLKQVFIDLDVQSCERLNSHNRKIEQLSLFARDISSDDNNYDYFIPEMNEHSSAIKCLLQEKFISIVIIGGPGQGKSTLGQQIAQIYRAKWLNKSYEFHEKVKIKRIPFRVVLKYFAQWLANKEVDNSLEAYLAEEMSSVSLRPGDISTHDIQDIFSCQDCLLILDGLDEVVDPKLQEQMLECIYSFLDWAEDFNINLKIVATSRPNIYQEQFDPKRFYHFELLSLSGDKVKEYAKKWVDARNLRIEEQQRILHTLEECQQDERTSSLLKTPLQVTIILLIIKNGGRPPGEREALFHKYWETILNREKSKDKDIIKSDDTTLLNLHAYLGYLLHCRAYKDNVKSLLSEAELQQAIVKILRKRDSKSSNEDIDLKVNQFVSDAKDRLVLIVSPQLELFGFELPSFREFFAAVYLYKTGQRFDNLKSIVCYKHWNNVALFLAGRIVRQLGDDDADLILRNVCRAVDRPQPMDKKNKNHLLLPGAWFALEVAADGSLSKNYRDLQWEAIEYGLQVLETGLTKKQRDDLSSLTRQLSEKDRQDLLLRILEGKFSSKNLPETCWKVALNLYGQHFGTTQFFLDKIDILLETQKKDFVLSGLELALLYKPEPEWMVERLQHYWSFWTNDIPAEFFRSYKYLEKLLNIWSFSKAEATQIAEIICNNYHRYIEIDPRRKIEWDMSQPKTFSEQLILMLRFLWFAHNWIMKPPKRLDIGINNDDNFARNILHVRTRLNYKSSPRSVPDGMTRAINTLLHRSDLMPWLRGSLWLIYWLNNQPNKTKVTAFLEDINSNQQIHKFIKKRWLYYELRGASPLLALVIKQQEIEGQGAVDKLLPFLDANTQKDIYEQIIGEIKEYFQNSEEAQEQQLIIALQTNIGLDNFLPKLGKLAESMGIKVEDLVKAYITVYPNYIFSKTTSRNYDNEQLSKLLATAYNLIEQGEIPSKLLWTIITNRWNFDNRIVKQIHQVLELIIDNYSESSEFDIASISVILFIKLLAYDTQIQEIATHLFATLPPAEILEARIHFNFIEDAIEPNSQIFNIIQSLLNYKEESVRIGIALVFKLIINSLKQRTYYRRYESQEFIKNRIDFNLGMSFINHECSKYRVVGITLLTISDYPVEDTKYRNLILDKLKQPQTDEEEEAWYRFLQEVYMPEEKHIMWHQLLEGILSKPSFYNGSILNLAMDRYQEISSSTDIIIPEID
ncbi:MAG: NACHT domain-containing protein [Cyanobacteria bacterium P01_C01_bin.38]